MTKKEKSTMNLTAWKIARRYLREEKKGASEDKLDGMFAVITTLEYMLGLDINTVMAEIEKGKTYEEIFGEE